MTDFQRMRYICDKTSRISERFVDEFLLYLCAKEEGLEEKFAQKLVKYKHIIEKMPEGWALWLMSQYIAFQLFRRGGLAQKKYVNHPKVLKRSAKELDFLKFQVRHPWRFVFCCVVRFLRDSFFEMTDVLTGEKFLLYSPAVANLEEEKSVSMYFLLIGFNGECWQTYGSVSYFTGLFPFDLLYFAKQVNSDPVSWDEIPMVIEEDPLPFMMLWVGADSPLVFHKKDLLVYNSSAYRVEQFALGEYTPQFFVEKKEGLYKLSLKRWHRFPHVCQCFYSERERILFISAYTERGYEKLITVLNQIGHGFPLEAQNRATMVMLTITRDILGKEVDLNPYAKYFAEQPSPMSPDEEQMMEKLNFFGQLLVETINSGKKYDLAKLAEQTGIDYDDAKQIAASIERMVSRNRFK
jgi:hypothetical protein